MFPRGMKQWLKGVYGFNTYYRDQWVKSWADRLPLGERVLDVGAGPGRYRSLFAHCEYQAHDFGQEPGTLGQYTALDYQSDILDIPVPDHSFGVILCTEVLEHVPDPVAAIREMARILKPGGRLLLTAPLGSFLHQEPYHFYGGYTPHWYRKFLPEAGFEIEHIEANKGFFLFFSQESQRFSQFIHPRKTWRLGIGRWIFLSGVWLAMLPLRIVLPPLGACLDGLELEQMATVGYHVSAVRNS